MMNNYKRRKHFLLLIACFTFQIGFSQNIQTISINTNKQYQTIEGFGTCVVDFHDRPEMPSHYDDSLYDMAVYDLGMSMVRFSFPQTMEWKNDNPDPNHFNWDGFQMEQLGKRMRVAQEFKQRGVDRFMVSTWSPPEFTKTHKSTIYGGHLRMDMYEEYAENFTAMIIAAKQNWNIDIGAVGLQNELLFIEPYKSCIYNPDQAREAVRALQERFLKEGIISKIIMPEDMMSLERMKSYVTPTLEDKQTQRFEGAFASHRLNEGEKLVQWADFIDPSGKQSWMTETSGHPVTWQGALELAEDIHQYLVLGNYSAWLYWQLSGGKTDVYALMDEHTPLPKYYTSKHFYRYVRPGAIRVESRSEGQVLTSAYVHPVSGQLTVILINNHEEAAKTITDINLKGITSLKGFLSTESKYFDEVEMEPGKTLEIPPKSILTFTVESPDLKTATQIDEWPEAWIPKGLSKGQKIGLERGQPRSKADIVCLEARNGNLEGLKNELKKADINAQTYNGWTALHHACLSGQIETMSYLLDHGADKNLAADDGWTPLHMAASTFSSHGSDEKISKPDVLEKFLTYNPDINTVTKEGFNALHATVMNAHTAYRQSEQEVMDRVDMLISAGIPVDAKDSMGRTALHWASWQAHANMVNVNSIVVEELIRQGADINLQDNLGNTALHYAVKMKYRPIIKALIENGANIETVNESGETPTRIAQKHFDPELVDMLQNKNFYEAQNQSQDKTSNGKLGAELLQAAWQGDKQKVLSLLEKGADQNYRDSDGFTALERARDGGHKDIMKLLEVWGKKKK